MKSFKAKLIKKSGKLVHVDLASEAKYKRFIELLPEDTEIKVEIEKVEKDKTYPQVKKIYQLIKDTSIHTGETFEEVKLRYKKKAGLVIDYRLGDEIRTHIISFADLDIEDASYIIEQFVQFNNEDTK